MRILSPFFLAAILLAACSSGGGGLKKPSGLIPDEFKGIFKKKQKDASSTVNPLIGITRAQFKGVPGPLLFAHLENTNAYASLNLWADNDGVHTFVTADGVSLSLKDGIVLATRGLGADLISADISASDQAVKARGAKDYQRIMRWLDVQDRTLTAEFTCEMISVGAESITILGSDISTYHLQEKCRSDQMEFSNDYWVGRSKPVIWESRQWLGDVAGYIEIQLLIE